jgi:hypothetical protein
MSVSLTTSYSFAVSHSSRSVIVSNEIVTNLQEAVEEGNNQSNFNDRRFFSPESSNSKQSSIDSSTKSTT